MKKVLRTFLLKTPLLFGDKRITEVMIHQLTHADRVEVTAAVPNPFDVSGQNKHYLPRMTGLPLEALRVMSYADGDELLYELTKMIGPQVAESSDVPAGYKYVLAEPLQTPEGVIESVQLKDLSFGDQFAAEDYSSNLCEQHTYLISKMTGLMLEDVMNLTIKDSYALPNYFRLVTSAAKKPDQDQSVPDQLTPGSDAGQFAQPLAA